MPPAGRLSRDQAIALLGETPVAARSPASWSCPVGPLTLRFPDFAWRRRALRAHDLHHAMTGYPMTMRGEFQMAAWEFGAGRYPHWGATLFCAPLVAAGLLLAPRRTWNAYRRGRRRRSLYGAVDALDGMTLADARRLVEGARVEPEPGFAA